MIRKPAQLSLDGYPLLYTMSTLLQWIHHYIPTPTLVGFVVGVLAMAPRRGLAFTFFAQFPGIVAHELAHWLTALVLFSQPGVLHVFPARSPEGGWNLGSVVFVPRWWSAGFVALAPLYWLPAASAWLVYATAAESFGVQLVSGYTVCAMCFSCVPSGADWRIAIRYPAATIGLFAGGFFELQHLFGKG